jgi:hypothetical protein
LPDSHLNIIYNLLLSLHSKDISNDKCLYLLLSFVEFCEEKKFFRATVGGCAAMQR